MYLLAIDTNIPVLLMTGFVLQGHIYLSVKVSLHFCKASAKLLSWLTVKCNEQANNTQLRHSHDLK